ncbi:MAG: hypothetical protein LBR09_02205 [Endomicrobium sp.]|jgi:hypothetical protein|nr:hypothetical protein [Endomicrobium sp.]
MSDISELREAIALIILLVLSIWLWIEKAVKKAEEKEKTNQGEKMTKSEFELTKKICEENPEARSFGNKVCWGTLIDRITKTKKLAEEGAPILTEKKNQFWELRS